MKELLSLWLVPYSSGSRVIRRLDSVGDKDSTDLYKVREIRTMQEFFKKGFIYLTVTYSEVVYSLHLH